ncbi:MAG TPA: response regulator transcription factor [Aquabacterium sp.]|uniref:response regulator transcription factor n=1 Tax=Aquabacterium sp. TaxID=1872578 RepID=UPI002E2FE385|nr:response regulator transcription factor [Aquabacterium sp.]HEX5354753.1 response regulator transcription factor [Aquabacterium sp.]
MNPGVRVLIVDDHPLFREGLKGLLSGLDPAVCIEQAASVQEAQALAGQTFDLVLMDLQMPGLSGMDALQRIKVLFEEAAVVVVSGDESSCSIHAAIQHGAAGYVPKSTDPGVTTHALRLVLAQGTYLPPAALQSANAGHHQSTGPQSQPNDPSGASERAPGPAWPRDLSPRQLSVLRCLLQGKPNKVIAREIGIAEGTVKAHLWAVYQMLGVSNRAQAMYRAHELNLFGVLNPITKPPVEAD